MIPFGTGLKWQAPTVWFSSHHADHIHGSGSVWPWDVLHLYSCSYLSLCCIGMEFYNIQLLVTYHAIFLNWILKTSGKLCEFWQHLVTASANHNAYLIKNNIVYSKNWTVLISVGFMGPYNLKEYRRVNVVI